jgi:hypothetical protein
MKAHGIVSLHTRERLTVDDACADCRTTRGHDYGHDADCGCDAPDPGLPFVHSVPERASSTFANPPRVSNTLRDGVGSVFQFAENVADEMVFDLAVTRNRLTGTGARILIPIVPAAVADEDASVLFDLPDEINPFHAIWSSAT